MQYDGSSIAGNPGRATICFTRNVCLGPGDMPVILVQGVDDWIDKAVRLVKRYMRFKVQELERTIVMPRS